MKRVKIYYVLRLLLSALFGVVLGMAILWADSYAVEVFDILFIALGVIAVLFNLPSFVLSVRAIAKKKKWEWINLVIALVCMGFGVSFLLVLRTAPAFPFVLLSYIVIVPVARIILVSERVKQLFLELPKVMFGCFLLVVTATKSEDRMFLVLGISIMVLSALYLAKGFLEMPKKCMPYEEKFKKQKDPQ